MPIQIETTDGWRSGVQLSKPVNDLQNTEARYIQDAFLDEETLLTQRGPVSGTTQSDSNYFPVGMFAATGSTGLPDVLVSVLGSTSPELTILLVQSGALSGSNFSLSLPDEMIRADAKPALPGGTLLGTTDAYNGVNQYLLYYKGSKSAGTTTGTVTVARGSKAVTGSGTSFSSAMVGCFLAATDDDSGVMVLLGEIESFTSTTSITLKTKSPYAITAKSFRIDPFRHFVPRVAKGRITTSTTSTTVTGASTKFKDQGLDSGTWNIYTKDMTFVGKVSSVSTNTGLTLTANAAVALNNDRFFALKSTAYVAPSSASAINSLVSAPGWLNSVYAGRQWYANGSTLRFSETFDHEAVDQSAVDGDFISIPTTQGLDSPIAAIGSTQNCLLCLKEADVQGVFGTTPSTFQLKKLGDDGTLHLGSVRPHEGGMLWAGRRGIYYYDGAQIENIIAESLGDWYVQAVADFSPSTLGHTMGSAIINNHYLLYITPIDPPRGVKKLGVDTVPTRITIAINLSTRAVTFLTNLQIHSSTSFRSTSVSGTLLGLKRSDGASWMRGENLFETTGADTLTCASDTLGPRFYIESKKHEVGDPQMKKLFKQLQVHHQTVGDSLTVETVTGLQETGVASLSTFPATGDGVFRNKRIKFLKRSQYLAFRLYPTNNTMTKLVIGPTAVGFKWQRPGRV